MNHNYMSLIGKLSREDDKSNGKTILLAVGIGITVFAGILYINYTMQRREIGWLQVENDRLKGLNATLVSSNNTFKQENSKLKNTNDRQMSENQQLRAELASYRKASGNDNVS